MNLVGSDEVVLKTALTDADGNFVFSNVDSDKELKVVIDEFIEVFFLDSTADVLSQEVLIGSIIEIGKAFDTKSIAWKSTIPTIPMP